MTRWKSLGHKGDFTENIIDHVNQIYEKRGLALVSKIPVPVKVTQISSGQITQAFFEKKSTVDYCGVFRGISICFDAKETNKDYLPLQNIHEHQVEYMDKFKKHGGFSFLICNFKTHGIYQFIPFEIVARFWEDSKSGGRKSIPMSALDPQYMIPSQNGLPDYIVPLSMYIRNAAKGCDC